ncbi:hypothetical protein SH601_00560 [Gracilibacillus sp. S3-1-1]|uniref:Uncharacterized protein n=1 Tax=Gracilibacillus pellucidus TaxID=3095368 RepID=A0ACC6M0J1_9BACI|nr:hypothetical protein [Gracilibacillus sp. S3-1-1]MDX8044464.1 hypothetical protein [Gracilibacillus sp. S3-1-1]
MKKGIIVIIIYAIIGFGIGIGGAALFDNSLMDISFTTLFLIIGVIILSYILHIIIHEFGHFIFGKMTGFTFISFRIFSIVWVKMDKKLVVKKIHVPGTLGQCLMMPPVDYQGIRPFKCYLLGGGLLNLIISGIAFSISFLSNFHSVYLYCFIVIGVFLATVNLIPMSINDGMLLKKAWNNQTIQTQLYSQLTFHALTTTGTRYHEIDEELIKIPEQLDYQNIWDIGAMLIHYNRAIETNDFNRAKEMIDNLYKNIDRHNFFYIEIAKEWAFCQMYFNLQQEHVITLFNARKLKTNLAYPMTNNLRVQAMYEWKINHNQLKATKLFEKGLSLTNNLPNKADILFETELITHCLDIMQSENPHVS